VWQSDGQHSVGSKHESGLVVGRNGGAALVSAFLVLSYSGSIRDRPEPDAAAQAKAVYSQRISRSSDRPTWYKKSGRSWTAENLAVMNEYLFLPLLAIVVAIYLRFKIKPDNVPTLYTSFFPSWIAVFKRVPSFHRMIERGYHNVLLLCDAHFGR
jgi:hypothetical protein